MDQVKFVEDSHVILNFPKTVAQKFYSIYSWIYCAIWRKYTVQTSRNGFLEALNIS